MQRAKQMLLIEPSLINKLYRKQNNFSDPVSRLDEEMKNILDTKMHDRKKVILYLQILQRFLHFNAKNRQPIELPIISKNYELPETNVEDESNSLQPVQVQTLKNEAKVRVGAAAMNPLYAKSQILNSIPQTYFKKGESLLNLISLSRNKIEWNDDDGTVAIDNKKISGSNIVDLVNDLLRPLKRSDPIGWENFAKALHDIKTPLTYLGNPKRIEYIQNIKLKESGEISTDEELMKPSPMYQKKIRKKSEWEKWSPY